MQKMFNINIKLYLIKLYVEHFVHAWVHVSHNFGNEIFLNLTPTSNFEIEGSD